MRIGYMVPPTLAGLATINDGCDVISENRAFMLQKGEVDALGHAVETRAIAPLGTFNERIDLTAEKTVNWGVKIDDLAASFATLAQIGGDSLGRLFSGIGTAIGSISVARKSVDSLKEGFSLLGSGDVLGSLAASRPVSAGSSLSRRSPSAASKRCLTPSAAERKARL